MADDWQNVASHSAAKHPPWAAAQRPLWGRVKTGGRWCPGHHEGACVRGSPSRRPMLEVGSILQGGLATSSARLGAVLTASFHDNGRYMLLKCGVTELVCRAHLAKYLTRKSFFK